MEISDFRISFAILISICQRARRKQVSVDKLNPNWSSSLMLGVLTHPMPDKLHLPVSALGLKKNSVVVCGDGVFRNGVRINRNR
jgi:hypothetical protein